MFNFPTDDVLTVLSVLISALIALLVIRLIINPKRQAKQAQRKVDEIAQRKALARMEEIRTIENDAKDPWSRTCTRDTIVRELTKSQRLSLEKIGQNY